MCEMTSIGEISAARITTPGAVVLETPAGDFRKALTTSLTPLFRVLFLAAITLLVFAAIAVRAEIAQSHLSSRS